MKAILEIDMPDVCEQCYFCRKRHGNYWCYVIEKNVDHRDYEMPDKWQDDDWEKSRHPDCPLKIVHDAPPDRLDAIRKRARELGPGTLKGVDQLINITLDRCEKHLDGVARKKPGL